MTEEQTPKTISLCRKTTCCPQLIIDNGQYTITDDFGGKVTLSEEHLGVLLEVLLDRYEESEDDGSVELQEEYPLYQNLPFPGEEHLGVLLETLLAHYEESEDGNSTESQEEYPLYQNLPSLDAVKPNCFSLPLPRTEVVSFPVQTILPNSGLPQQQTPLTYRAIPLSLLSSLSSVCVSVFLNSKTV